MTIHSVALELVVRQRLVLPRAAPDLAGTCRDTPRRQPASPHRAPGRTGTRGSWTQPPLLFRRASGHRGCPRDAVLALPAMTRNTALKEGMSLPDSLAGRSIVLVGLMGAGKTSIGRRLAARLGLPFRDADSEIELAAGCTIPELFSRYGERAFRDGERRVIRRLLAGDQLVLAFGGGAFMDTETRAATRAEAVSVWLRCPLPTLVRRVAGRDHRPLLADGDPTDILQRLIDQRYPIYAEADVIVDCGDESPDVTTDAGAGRAGGVAAAAAAVGGAAFDQLRRGDRRRSAGARRRVAGARAAAEARGGGDRCDGGGAASADAATRPRRDRHRHTEHRRAGRRSVEEPAILSVRAGSVAGSARRAAHHGDRAGRRRGRRPRRLRGGHGVARPAVRADPHHAAVAGGFLGRRQDRR